jgi:hypothetical protein
MNTVEASLITTVQMFPEVANIQLILNLAPIRDKLTMAFRNDSDDILIVSNKQSTNINLSELIDGMMPEDKIKVTIQIDKTVSSNKFSIYNF